MKGARYPAIQPIPRYVPGDLLLELARTGASGQGPLHVLSGQPDKPDDKQVDDFFDVLKPSKDDYPALKSTLQLLKFSPENVNSYFNSIGMLINIASAAVWAVGAFQTVASLINTILGPKPDVSLQYLQHISQRVDQIYGYLAAQAKKGLHAEAVKWRQENMMDVRNAVHNARESRSPLNLKQLVDLKKPLDDNLAQMLDPENANIPFFRQVYGYPQPGQPQVSHWIDAATPPFMAVVGGTPVHYRDPAQELQGEIWDPGHYIDVLIGSLADRILLVSTTEPAFRATSYDRPQLEQLVSSLTTFLYRWSLSLIVADPLAGLNDGGPLQNPLYMPPPGIVIGAVDPVTGIAFFNPYWDDFGVVEIWKGSVSAKGMPDETRAKDPVAAKVQALDLHPRLLQGAISASGIPRFDQYRAYLHELMTQYTVGSDFVHLPNAWFSRVQLSGPTAVETVDLGFIGKYSQHPDQKYQGQRYSQILKEHFRFAMAARTDVSLIQLGYRMELGDRSIELIPYSVAPADGLPAPRFPTQPISMEIRSDSWITYDVYQSAVFSEADEDDFEGAKPPPISWKYRKWGEEVISQQISPALPASPLVQKERSLASATEHWLNPAERIFLNPHVGPVALKVDITFESELDSPEQPFVGYANVTIRNLDPGHCSGGVILFVRVNETRPDTSSAGGTQEVQADYMTIHIVPSFLVLPEQYFQDRREGHKTLFKIFEDLNELYAISVSQPVPVGPEWQVRRRAVEEAAMDDAIQEFVRESPDVALPAVQRFVSPSASGGATLRGWTQVSEPD